MARKIQVNRATESEDKPFSARFEFDLATPFFHQVTTLFDALGTAPLTIDNIVAVESHQGLYGLYLDQSIVYVGKSDQPLPDRLRSHLSKIAGRKNLDLRLIQFKAVYMDLTWVPLVPETRLINHYKRGKLCEWNGNGFGPHDPGRNREETNKPPDGFDAQYPIRGDWKCEGIPAGDYEANELLLKIKGLLPFCFRYETDNPRGGWRSGSQKYNGRMIRVPEADLPASTLIASVAKQLGPSWQATIFPSHIILYEEKREYAYGTVLTC